MKARRRLVAVAVACALALGGSVAVAAPASAKASDCKTGQFCTFLHINYEGAYTNADFASDLRLWAALGVVDFNDKISSVINNKGSGARVHEHINYQGHSYWVAGKQSRSDLRNYTMSGRTSWNDQVSSFK